MTQEEICKIVCDCISQVGLAPGDWDQAACEASRTEDLSFGEADISSLQECIKQKVQEQGCTAMLGHSQWESADTVKRYCEMVFFNTNCPE